MTGECCNSNKFSDIRDIVNQGNTEMENIVNKMGLYLEKYLALHLEGFVKYTNITLLLKAWLPALLTKVVDVSQEPQGSLQGLKYFCRYLVQMHFKKYILEGYLGGLVECLDF